MSDERGNEPVSLGYAWVKQSTDKALQCRLEWEDIVIWAPQSVIHDDSEVFDAGEHSEGDLVVKRWWAENEGLT